MRPIFYYQMMNKPRTNLISGLWKYVLDYAAGDKLSIMINYIFPRKGVLNAWTVNSIQIALKYW